MKFLKISALFILIATSLYAEDGETIAALDLDAVGIKTSEVQVLSNRIRSLLVNTSRFRVLERANMEGILIEQGFQQSGCTSDECLVEAGQLLGVQKMLAGSVGKFGTVYTIDLRIIDVETGKIESSATYDYRGEMENLLLEGASAALKKLLSLYQAQSFKPADKYSYLKIITNVPDALILIDANISGVGKTNLIPLNPGRYSLSVQHKYYLPLVDDVELSEGDTVIHNLKLIRAEGLLKLSGKPDESIYEIADQKGNSGTAIQFVLPAGKHQLKLFSPYYYPLYENLEMIRDTTISVNFNLIYGAEDLSRKQNQQKWLNIGTLSSLGLTVLSAILAESFYNKYQNAESSDEATKYKDLTTTFDKTTKILGGITVTISAFTVWNWLSTNNLKRELHVP